VGVFTTPTGPRSRLALSRAGRGPAPSALPAPHPARSLGPGPARPAPYRAHRSLTAAAKQIDLSDTAQAAGLAKRRASGTDAWQQESWEYYDAIGEIKFAFSLVANVLSRVRLYAAEVDDPSAPPVAANPDEPGGGAAIAALRKLDSAFGGQPGLLRDAALNLCVTGECYLVQQPAGHPLSPNPAPESWDIRSVDELEVKTDGTATLVTRRDAGSDPNFKRPLSPKAFTARIWRPHPRYSDEADSSMRGLLDACAELMLLNKTYRATARSRLNAGMLLMPDGMAVSSSPDPDAGDPDSELHDPAEQDEDEFEESLIDAMTTPIMDEESASSVVPLLVRGPADLLKEIRPISFERSFDDSLAARGDKVLDRILAGIDVPKDVVAGMANVKYANAAVIDESLYKAHIEPLALLLCDALTVVYLRPALKAAGIDPSEWDRYVVWYDPSEVTTRPNKSEDAKALYGDHLVSGEAVRRAHGFSEEDKPDANEMAYRFLLDHGAGTPELTEALLSIFAPDVMNKVREASQANSPAPLPPEVAQALGGAPAADPAQTPDDAAPASTPTQTQTPAPATPATPEQTFRPEDLV